MRNNISIFIKASRGTFAFPMFLFIVAIIFIIGDMLIGGLEHFLKMYQPPLGFAIMGLGFFIWMKGFYLKLENDMLIYRDGMYKKHIFKISEIEKVCFGSEYFKNVGPQVSVPRIIVVPNDGRKIVTINMKLFGFTEIQNFYKELKRSVEDSNKCEISRHRKKSSEK